MNRKAIFEIFPVKAGGFGWHVKRGGRIIAVSREPYLRRRGAQRAITNLATAIAGAEFRVDILYETPKRQKTK